MSMSESEQSEAKVGLVLGCEGAFFRKSDIHMILEATIVNSCIKQNETISSDRRTETPTVLSVCATWYMI